MMLLVFAWNCLQASNLHDNLLLMRIGVFGIALLLIFTPVLFQEEMEIGFAESGAIDHHHDPDTGYHHGHSHHDRSETPCQDSGSHHHHNSHCCYTPHSNSPLLMLVSGYASNDTLVDRAYIDESNLIILPTPKEFFHPPNA